MSVPSNTEVQVIPVAGRDSMLLNLSGAHGPFFTRNLVILKDNAGHTGVGEVPGGEKIRQALEATGKLARAVYVERGTMDATVCQPLADKPDDRAPYFSIVLVPGWAGRP